MAVDSNALNIFTDGSSLPNPRRGGEGFVFLFPECMNRGMQVFCPAGYQKATNNQMELQAIILALEEAAKLDKQWQRIVIHTDSCYVYDNYKRAMFEWCKHKWFNLCGRPVANADLWKELLRKVQKVGVQFDICWVKGHHKDELNKIADKMAKQSARSLLNKPLFNVNVRKKTSNKITEIGSVKMEGQKLMIRIVGSQYLAQKVTQYRFEVVSKTSPYFGCVDFVYCNQTLRAAHVYSVRLNKEQKYPQIMKIYKDITKEKKDRDGE
jgi:ribonuclease HI